MASTSAQGSPPRSEDAQLADFRIRDLNADQDAPLAAPLQHGAPVTAHGVIRGLPKSRYDSLIQDNPLAALQYVDDDDGETITVGSSYELDQRLKEPFNPALAPRPSVGASSVHPDDVQLLHTFNLNSRDRQTLQLWQSLQSSRQTAAAATARSSSSMPVWARARAFDIKGKTPRSDQFEMDRVLRWASETPPHNGQPMTQNLKPREKDSSSRSWRCSVPTCDWVSNSRETLAHHVGLEHKTPEASSEPKVMPESNVLVDTPHKPLLELFEAELARLVPEKDVEKRVTASSSAEPAAISPAADPDTSVPLATNSASPSSPADLLANTISSMLTGLGSFAARVDEANPQIREQITQAHSAGQEAAFNLLSRIIPEIQGRAAAAGVRPVSFSQDSRRPSAPTPSVAVATSPRAPVAAAAASSSASCSPGQQRTCTYEAERILASRYICYDNLNYGGPRYRQYLVRWAGCGPTDDVWYDEDNLKTSCQPLIDLYERTRGQNPTQAQQAAELHRRTAGNRMMASTMMQESSSSTGDILTSAATRTIVQPESQPAPSAKREDQESRVSQKLPQEQPQTSIGRNTLQTKANENEFKFDPSSILAQRVHEYPRGFAGMSSPTEDSPLRRARSLAFRNHARPDAPFYHRESLCSKAIPSLRRAATTIHRNVESNHARGVDVAESFLNNFEASRGRYLPRRAATTRSAYRNSESRADAAPQSDQVRRCVGDLVKMGYRLSEAETVAALCDGDMSKALDQLEEDRKAWLWRSNNDAAASTAVATEGNMPGSWDVYRW